MGQDVAARAFSRPDRQRYRECRRSVPAEERERLRWYASHYIEAADRGSRVRVW